MQPSIDQHPALSLFAELLAVPSPTGHEQRLAQIVRRKVEAWGYEPRTDGAGNVTVRIEGRRPGAPLCLAAHMDEIGVVVTRIEPDGSLRVDRAGGLHPWKIGEGPLQILGDRDTVAGILSMGSAHSAAGSQGVGWGDVRVLTGLSPEGLKAAGVRPGSAGVPAREGRGPVLLGDPADPLVAAWTFDDRMGVVALLRLLEAMRREGIEPWRTTVVAFTVHEEGSGHGARLVAQRERPEAFIAVDGCPMPPGAPLQLDGRPGIWAKDSLVYYDQGLVRDLCQAAEEAGTELQPVVYDSAGSDASLICTAGAAERVACFGHVRENSHGYEVARLAVFDNVLKTLVAFAGRWQG